jgi:hypothetical protein
MANITTTKKVIPTAERSVMIISMLHPIVVMKATNIATNTITNMIIPIATLTVTTMIMAVNIPIPMNMSMTTPINMPIPIPISMNTPILIKKKKMVTVMPILMDMNIPTVINIHMDTITPIPTFMVMDIVEIMRKTVPDAAMLVILKIKTLKSWVYC